MNKLIVNVFLSGTMLDSFAVAVDTPDASAAMASAIAQTKSLMRDKGFTAPAISKARFVVKRVPGPAKSKRGLSSRRPRSAGLSATSMEEQIGKRRGRQDR